MKKAKETILLTGAAGYIGSHTWCALVQNGYRVVGLDNLCNSDVRVIERITRITGETPTFIRGDIRDAELMDETFHRHRISAIIHFAALKSVAESVREPIAYYENNLHGLLVLLQSAARNGVKNFLFSSSATVYGDPASVPIKEDFPLSATNPYGWTKLMGERMLRDIERADTDWRIGYLRYFNPVGAHESGLIGEAPNGIPNNLLPYVSQVAVGKLEKLKIYGNDYPTSDGTGVRDYIHVMDLAQGHVAAIAHLLDGSASFTVNLGTGRGYSVLEVVQAYERASDRRIPYEIVGRRDGDIPSCYADASLAAQLLGWRANRDLDDMCADSWRWQSMNPNGFGSD